jgi:hypothetical protein
MTPLFSAHDDQLAQRLATLPLTRVAAELLARGFGADGDDRPTLATLIDTLAPRPRPSAHGALREALGEALAALERARLVRGLDGGEARVYAVTGAGRALREQPRLVAAALEPHDPRSHDVHQQAR